MSENNSSRVGVATIYSPKSTNELIGILAKEKNTVIFGGGTYLMSRKSFYPHPDLRNVVLTSSVPELCRVYHSESYIEAGCAVTLQQLLNTGAYILSRPLEKALNALGSSMLRSQMTLGGALCTRDTVFSLPCYLSAINAEVEIKIFSIKGKGKRVSTRSRWYSITKLYSVEGKLEIPENSVMTRIRIPSQEGLRQIYKTLGSPMSDPESAVVFALSYKDGKTMTEASMRLALPKAGFFASTDFDTFLSGFSFPLSIEKIKKISEVLVANIEATLPDATRIQLERAKRQLQTVLFEINTRYLQH